MDKQAEALRILMLEDVPSEAELVAIELRDAGLELTSLRVDTRAAFEQALDEFKPDIVLADYNLPAYNGRDALEYSRRTHPQIPVIMVTGAMGDEAAVELLKLGARDYVLKDRLARLVPAIKRTLSEERGIHNRKLAEGKYKALFNEAMDGIVLVDCATWQVEDCNPEFEKQAGRTLAQIKALQVWELYPKKHHELVRHRFIEVRKTGKGHGGDIEVQRPGGDTVPVEYAANFLSLQQRSFVQVVTRDISERLRAERALQDSEARYRRITEGITDYQYTVRIENGRAAETRQSPACVTVTGYTAEEFAANPNLWIQMVVPEDRERVIERVRHVLAGMDVPPMEHRIIRKDGELRWVHCTIIQFKDASGKLLSYDGVIKDISERKYIEQVIQEEKAFSDILIQNLPDVFYLFDSQGNMLRWNRMAEKLLGLSADEISKTNVISFIHEEDRPLIIQTIRDTFDYGSAQAEARLLSKDGLRDYVFTGIRVITKLGTNVIGMGIDITGRKQAELALRRANRSLKTLSAGNLALVRAKSEDELLRAVTNVIVETGGYRLAVVDYAENNPEKSLTPMAWSGMEENDCWAKHLSWADTEQGQLPVSMAIRSGTSQVCHDIASAPIFEPWRALVLARGYASNIALPLSGGGRIFGGLSIFAAVADAFDAEEVRLLEELANDLAYGIVSLRTRAEHEQQAMILLQSLEQSIQTIANTVEARDPYTAGHQRRVAELAAAIAREMGLPDEQVNGLHLAATIHDLGKIHIPAEILSRPGKLSEIEYMLVKTHPQDGYDILKNVNFPWPIAQMVLQHHEKLDGSGYPQGLKGDQIIIEARILAVADLVEAMSSHRPYRPGLGIDAALSEIVRMRGTHFDPVVVDACVALFREKKYVIPS